MGSLLRLLGGRRRAVGGGDISAASLDELVSTIASTWTVTDGPQDGGTLTINSVGLGSYDYVVLPAGTTISSFEAASYFTTTEDSRWAIIVCKGDLTINDAVTPSVRKLGCIIGTRGTINGSGSISMTARGADHSAATGSNVTAGNILIYSGQASGITDPEVPAAGGAGGTGVSGSAVGNDGTAGSGGGTGGGGSGGSYNTGATGAGAAGTCFSGGSGSGGAATGGTSSAASADGGPGSAGAGSASNDAGGGAGNPGGAGVDTGEAGESGTGGILYVVCGTLAGSLTLSADGADGGEAGIVTNSGNGAGSGGGGVHVLCDTDNSTTSMSAAGGLGGTNAFDGGDGGAGTTRIMMRDSWGPAAIGTYYEYRMIASGQVLPGFGSANDGDLGSTTGSDANDPTAVTEGLSFDGADYVECNTTIPSGDRTVIVVMQSTQTAASKFVLQSATWPAVLHDTGSPGTMRFAGGSTPTASTSPTSLHDETAWHSYGFTWDQADIQWYRDGATAGAAQAYASVSAAWPLKIGAAGSGFIGKIAWVLVFTDVLTDAQMALAHNYIRSAVSGRGITLAEA